MKQFHTWTSYTEPWDLKLTPESLPHESWKAVPKWTPVPWSPLALASDWIYPEVASSSGQGSRLPERGLLAIHTHFSWHLFELLVHGVCYPGMSPRVSSKEIRNGIPDGRKFSSRWYVGFFSYNKACDWFYFLLLNIPACWIIFHFFLVFIF